MTEGLRPFRGFIREKISKYPAMKPMKEVSRPSRGNRLIIRERNAVIRSWIAAFPLFRERNAVIRSRIATFLPFWSGMR
ncbi:MAG: hypothetical protein IKH11_01835, partial [Bacteroidales bacterium]|nr:hypothetical protein [Bacteroidales bacterium]